MTYLTQNVSPGLLPGKNWALLWEDGGSAGEGVVDCKIKALKIPWFLNIFRHRRKKYVCHYQLT